MNNIMPLRARFLSHSCWKRLLDAPNHPGSWGKCLVGLLAFGWSFNLTFGDQTLESWGGLASLIDQFGKGLVAFWLFLLGILPIVGVAIGSTVLNVVFAGAAAISWMWLLIQSYQTDSLSRAAVWTCLAGFAAFANAEWQLTTQWVRETQRSGRSRSS